MAEEASLNLYITLGGEQFRQLCPLCSSPLLKGFPLFTTLCAGNSDDPAFLVRPRVFVPCSCSSVLRQLQLSAKVRQCPRASRSLEFCAEHVAQLYEERIIRPS